MVTNQINPDQVPNSEFKITIIENNFREVRYDSGKYRYFINNKEVDYFSITRDDLGYLHIIIKEKDGK